jgi:hypothetical protein
MKNINHKKLVYALIIVSVVSYGLISYTFAQNSTDTLKSTEVIVKNQAIVDAKPNLLVALGLWFGQLLNTDTFTTNIALTITEVTSTPTKSEALLTWNASNLADGRVYYDTATPLVISSSTPFVTPSQYGNYANSKATIRFLNANTTYYLKIYLEDNAGNKAVSKELSFTTRPN